MHHDHSHAVHEAAQPDSGPRAAVPRGAAGALRAAFALTVAVMLLEAVGGAVTGSVALIADAGHMLTDAGSLGIALLAAWVSSRPRDAQMSFGYGRAEVLAALVNGALLGGVSVGVGLESIERLREPRSIAAAPVIAIAGIGLLANLLAARWLASAARRNLNVRAALAHVLGDALGSVAALSAGLAIALGGWRRADALAGLAIAGLLIVSAVRLIRDSVDVLLERVPSHLDLKRIAAEIRELPGVADVHDLHIWTVNSGFLAMSGHVDVARDADAERVRHAVHELLHQRYEIAHTTIQTEVLPALLTIEAPPAAHPTS
jgi:cobalt-zinc-cadmium efflux system protein